MIDAKIEDGNVVIYNNYPTRTPAASLDVELLDKILETGNNRHWLEQALWFREATKDAESYKTASPEELVGEDLTEYVCWVEDYDSAVPVKVSNLAKVEKREDARGLYKLLLTDDSSSSWVLFPENAIFIVKLKG